MEKKYHLKYADYPGDYRGFTLKKGYFYGRDSDGIPIAASGWECGENVFIYTLANGKWEGEWVCSDLIELVDNLPQVNTQDKLDFPRWLEREMGIDWDDYDENYSGQSQSELETKFRHYLYDGLPDFCIPFIK